MYRAFLLNLRNLACSPEYLPLTLLVPSYLCPMIQSKSSFKSLKIGTTRSHNPCPLLSTVVNNAISLSAGRRLPSTSEMYRTMTTCEPYYWHTSIVYNVLMIWMVCMHCIVCCVTESIAYDWLLVCVCVCVPGDVWSTEFDVLPWRHTWKNLEVHV